MSFATAYPTRRSEVWKKFFDTVEITKENKSAYYDAVVVINERLINEASAALFYNNFLTFNGEMDFRKGPLALPADVQAKIPDTLNSFLMVKYRCKLLQEPMVNFNANKTMSLQAVLRLYIWMMDGLELKFDAHLKVSAPLDFGMKDDNQIAISFKDCSIDELRIGLKGSGIDVDNFDVVKTFRGAITAYMKNEAKPIVFKLPVFSTYLPGTIATAGNEFNVRIAAVRPISEQELAVAFNFFDHVGGSPEKLQPFAPNSNVAIALSNKAMLDVYDFFWNHFEAEKCFGLTKTFEINVVNQIAEFGFKVQNLVMKAALDILTLGFIEHEQEFEKIEFICDVDVDIKTKPSIQFLTGNLVRVTNIGAGIKVGVKAILYYTNITKVDTSGAIPDKCTPWDDDIVISKKRVRKEIFNVRIGLKNTSVKSCSGELYLDEEDNAIKLKIKEFVLGNIFASNCPVHKFGDVIITWLVNHIAEHMILPKLPSFTLSPSIINVEIPGVSEPARIEGRKLKINPNESIIAANVSFEKFRTITEPMPKYVGNRNTMEVHRLGCDCIYDTYETHQRGYYSLQKALCEGYDGCQKCLPGYHRR